MKNQLVSTHRLKAGFSLVEVTIAMGIVASVMMALLALLPFGMDSIRDAKNTLVTSRIANEMVTELQSIDWGQQNAFLESYSREIFYFDSEGTRLKSKDGPDMAYRVQVTIKSPEKNPILPGVNAAQNGAPRDYRREAEIKVAFAPEGREVNFAATGSNLPYRQYNTILAKLGFDPKAF
jgi:uncharacterized protein (TIGR02598 family)